MGFSGAPITKVYSTMHMTFKDVVEMYMVRKLIFFLSNGRINFDAGWVWKPEIIQFGKNVKIAENWWYWIAYKTCPTNHTT